MSSRDITKPIKMKNVRTCGNSLVLMTVSLLFTQLFSLTQAYLITVDAGIENECFHERVPIGTKLGFSFEVVEGGFFDIDIEIKDPANVILHQDERSSSGKFTIEATMEGPYQFCFSNKRSSLAPKVMIFDIDTALPGTRTDTTTAPGGQAGDSKDAKSDTADDSETSKLFKMVDQLMMSTITARHDVRYLTVRDRVHRKINEKTNRTIVWWSGIEFILLLSVTVGQVLYLKRFFEIRRKA